MHAASRDFMDHVDILLQLPHSKVGEEVSGRGDTESQTTGANTLLAPAPKTRGLERAMSTAAVKAAMVIMETIATTAVCSGHQAIQPAKHQEPLLSPG